MGPPKVNTGTCNQSAASQVPCGEGALDVSAVAGGFPGQLALKGTFISM